MVTSHRLSRVGIDKTPRLARSCMRLLRGICKALRSWRDWCTLENHRSIVQPACETCQWDFWPNKSRKVRRQITVSNRAALEKA